MARLHGSKNASKYQVIKLKANISSTKLEDILNRYSRERYELDQLYFIPNIGLRLILIKKYI